MSLYAVKNDKGEWLGWEVYQDDPEFICGGGSVWTDLDKAKFYAKANGGYVVELVEAPAKIVVSEEEAKVLETAKHNPTLRPSFMITEYSNSHKGNILGNDLEDRLMSAYVIGWVVAKPKQWNVKVPHSTDGYYWRGISGRVHTYTEPDQHARVLKTDAYTWTQKQIDDAGLHGCEKVEVKE